MSKFKKFLSSPFVTIGAFALAVVLLLASTAGGARAALKYYSETYASRVQMYDIGVSLLENGKKVSSRDYDSTKANGTWVKESGTLLTDIPDDSFVIGQTYPETISVKNSGTINEYVRVTIYKYWAELDTTGSEPVVGEKKVNRNPAFIEIAEVENSGWIKDETSSTAEREVYYYSKLLNSDEETPSIVSSVRVSDAVMDKAVISEQEKTDASGNKYTEIITSYEYDGLVFVIEAEVDAVQEHNAEDAILSSWGRKVKISDKTLSLD